MTHVVVKNVSKSFGKVDVLHNISFALERGTFLVVVGPSGCGKSTLLRIIAGLESVSEGTIAINDVIVNKIPPKDRDIAMVFQNYALYPHMTVYDNMAYGLRNRGFSKDECLARVLEAAQILKIQDYLERKPGQLSGGQRQRVAMGRAIVRHPEVFLFDEPLSNLDAQLRSHMRLEIKRLQRTLGVTSLYVTHDQIEAMTLADQIIVLNQGRIEQMGDPLTLYDFPATLFVAQFIGSPPMNLLAGTWDSAQSCLAFSEDHFALPSHLNLATSDITMGLRPDHTHLMKDGANLIPLGRFLVEFVEALGSDCLLYGRLQHDRGPAWIMRCDVHAKIQPGHVIDIGYKAQDLHLFDSASGCRLENMAPIAKRNPGN